MLNITTHVTGICISHPNREALCDRAVHDFLWQTVNHKRLLVYATGGTEHYHRLQQRFNGEPEAHVIAAEKPGPAAALAAALEEISHHGDESYLALWDDDIVYHNGYLERQIAAAAQHDRPSYLSAAAWHFTDSNELFIYDQEKRGQPLQTRVIPFTMVAKVGHLPEAMRARKQRRDADGGGGGGGSVTTALGYEMLQHRDVHRPEGEWWWMIARVAGGNANGYEWHRRNAADPERCKGVAWLLERRSLIKRWLDDYHWSCKAVDVCGHDGVAFSYEPHLTYPEIAPVVPPAEDDSIVHVTEEL